MEALSIFVASSTESEGVARAIQQRLRAELGKRAVVDLWRSKFAVSETAIESLETVAEEADFAVVVMSADDRTVSRKTESVAPRDNLVFELGLFVGALGRERSFIFREATQGKALKLPSDILGVTVLTYNTSTPNRLTSSIRAESAKLAAQMIDSGARPKWLALGRKELNASADFARSVRGSWWERIDQPEGSVLSLFTISPDPLTGGLALEGTSYDREGTRSALWKSEMVRVYPSNRRIAYLWQGQHPKPGVTQKKFHGYGTMDFAAPSRASAACASGIGDFWDVDESSPDKTTCHPVLIRRASAGELQKMGGRSSRPRQDLLRRLVRSW